MRSEPILDPGQVIRAGERVVARTWRLIALRGTVAITFAVVLLAWPGIGLTAMVWAAGLSAIASGLVSAAGALALLAPATRG